MRRAFSVCNADALLTCMKTKLPVIVAVVCAALKLNATPTITVHAEQPGAKINLTGIARAGLQAKAIVLSGHSLEDVNSMGGPAKVAPVESIVEFGGAADTQNFAPRSLTVLRIKAQ